MPSQGDNAGKTAGAKQAPVRIYHHPFQPSIRLPLAAIRSPHFPCPFSNMASHHKARFVSKRALEQRAGTGSQNTQQPNSRCRRSPRLIERDERRVNKGQRSLGLLLSSKAVEQASRRERSLKRKRLQHDYSSDIREPFLKQPRTNNPSVEYWVRHSRWPKGHSKFMERLFARPRSLRRTESSASWNTRSETNSREAKSNPYSDKNCEILLEAKGSFMGRHENGISSSCQMICKELLENKNPEAPQGTKFDDEVFQSTCERVQRQNGTAVIRKIADLIVPSAEDAIDLGCVKFKHLVESVNEGWDNSVSFDEAQRLLQPGQPLPTPQLRLPRPQPDYAVGFSRRAFTDDQLHKLAPFIGGVEDTSFFMGSAYISTKCTQHDFDFTALGGRDRWISYKFVINVYNGWAPSHFERLCSVIDDLPKDVNFGVSPQSKVQTEPQPQPEIYGRGPTETTSLSQEIGGVNLQGSSFTSLLEEESQQVAANPRNVASEATPRTKAGQRKDANVSRLVANPIQSNKRRHVEGGPATIQPRQTHQGETNTMANLEQNDIGAMGEQRHKT